MASDTATNADSRFEFGENWRRFAESLPPERTNAARRSLEDSLGLSSLAGMSFLDVGSGSGLFSLAAALMGADRVRSFDYDANSVQTTQGLKNRFLPDSKWEIERGNALDRSYMESLGQWDVVYSWGVLHHTGDLWKALANVVERVAPGGRLFISVYNDQGWASRAWRSVKLTYNRLPVPLKTPFAVLAMLPMELRTLTRHALKRRPGAYFREWRARGEYDRGMSRWHDLLDWVGGFPFEVAKPEEVFRFCVERGFELRWLRTVGGSHGCNEFVFVKAAR